MELLQKLSQVSPRERRILLLAALLAAVFAISRLIPTVQGVYAQRAEELFALQRELARETALLDNTADLRQRRAQAEQRGAELEEQVFTGATVPLIEANIQRVLSDYARNARIAVISTRLAERWDGDGWILISQEMEFRTVNAAYIIDFLQDLEASKPRLYVTEFNLAQGRVQYSGSITVVGFARSEGLTSESDGEES